MKFSTRRTLIAVYEIVSGAIQFALGIILYGLGSIGSKLAFSTIALEELREDPTDWFVLFLQRHFPGSWHTKEIIAFVLIGYGLIKIIGGIGLFKKKTWGYYLLTGFLLLLFPPDLYRLITNPSIGFGILLTVHFLILFPLVRYRQSFLHVE